MVVILAGTALLGFLDDLNDLSAALRFPIQALLIGLVVYVFAPLPNLYIFDGIMIGGLGLSAIVLFAGLWWLNLFNFMDGIDGLASSQAIIIIIGGVILVYFGGPPGSVEPIAVFVGCIVAASCGFLVRNWPPAKIFLGDVGSNVLAMVVLIVALWSLGHADVDYAAWVVLPSVLIADTTATLIRRLLRGERPWRAHRRHAYQNVARRWGHRNTTIAYAVLTLFWALPWALAAQLQPNFAWWLTLLAYAPLVALALRYNAGGSSDGPS